MTKDCARCGRTMNRMEGIINERWLCHPDDPELPDCYTIESQEFSGVHGHSRWLGGTEPLERQLVVRVNPALMDSLRRDAHDNGRTVAQSARFHLAAQLSAANADADEPSALDQARLAQTHASILLDEVRRLLGDVD